MVSKRVLVACEESQRVCIAFREAGHEAFSCDLQDPSGGYPEWHIKADAIGEAYSGKYDLLIAHPPCTYLSKAGARWMYPKKGEIDHERLNMALKAKEFFMLLLNSPIKQVAVENPTPLKVVGLPRPSQVIQPYQYGHPYSKRTLLWLKNLPELVPTDQLQYFSPFLPSNTGGKSRGQKYSRGVAKTSKEASKTFCGVAVAMANQWGDV